MSDTPKTDKIFEQFGPQFSPAPMAYFSLCRELERENAKLRKELAAERQELKDDRYNRNAPQSHE